MKREDVASTYAQAIVDIAEAEGKISGIEKEIFVLKKLISSKFEVRDFLGTEGLSAEKKVEVLDKALKGRVSKLLLAFIRFVVFAGRAKIIGDICDRSLELLSKARNKVFVEVVSAVKLDKGTVVRISDFINRQTNAIPVINVFIDKSILGGVIIKYDGTVLDLSLRNKLKDIRENVDLEEIV
ncbi:MAG: ATP synthase F1 subunit delta [Actinobacteria bacterium]|nr:ATP synthase F1 subunit delta [Actinomycetota bacterium]